MAEEKKSLPSIPSSHWWALRKKFRQTLPKGAIDGNYLSTLFGISEASAKNLIPPLKRVGLLDDTGKATDLANKWRHDDTYAEACQQMLDAVYPGSLKDVEPGPVVDKSQAAQWISKHLGVGENAAQKMAALYALIAEADPSKEFQDSQKAGNSDAKPTPKKSGSVKSTSKAKPTSEEKNATSEVKEGVVPPIEVKSVGFSPTVHLDVQIHISPEASNEQIERIFEAMGKHLFNRGKGE